MSGPWEKYASEPAGPWDKFKSAAAPLAKGAVKGGPFGLAVAGVGEALKGLENIAYKTGGAVTDAAAPHMPPEIAAGLGAAANVGVQTIPMVLGDVASRAVLPITKPLGRRLMQSAIKPTTADHLSGKAAKATETMLEGGYNPTMGGVNKMRTLAGELDDRVTGMLSGNPATIDPKAAAARAQDAVRRFEMQVNPSADVKAIENSITEFLAQHGSPLPVQNAHLIKQGTYRALTDKAYGEVGSAATEAQKAIARGLKEEISAAVPEVAPLNAKISDLINATKVAQRRAMLEANNNPFGLALLAPNPASMAGMLLDKWGLSKGLLARALYSGPPWAGRLGGAYLGALSGRAPEDNQGVLSRLIENSGN